MPTTSVTITWRIVSDGQMTLRNDPGTAVFTARWDLGPKHLDMVVEQVTGRYPLEQGRPELPGKDTALTLTVNGSSMSWPVSLPDADNIDSWMHIHVGKPAEIRRNGEIIDISDAPAP